MISQSAVVDVLSRSVLPDNASTPTVPHPVLFVTTAQTAIDAFRLMNDKVCVCTVCFSLPPS